MSDMPTGPKKLATCVMSLGLTAGPWSAPKGLSWLRAGNHTLPETKSNFPDRSISP